MLIHPRDFWLYDADYIAQGLTKLLFLYVIFKLARQDVKGLASVSIVAKHESNNVNNFSEHIFSGEIEGQNEEWMTAN